MIFGRIGMTVAAGALTAGLVVGAYWQGKHDGKRQIVAEIATVRIEDLKEKERINDEINSLSDDALLLRALGAVRPSGR